VGIKRPLKRRSRPRTNRQSTIVDRSLMTTDGVRRRERGDRFATGPSFRASDYSRRVTGAASMTTHRYIPCEPLLPCSEA
jgi:hypothetical protein